MPWIISDDNEYMPVTDYVAGGTYFYRREKYAVLTENRSEAKLYSSKRKAERALDKMKFSCVNISPYAEVEEL